MEKEWQQKIAKLVNLRTRVNDGRLEFLIFEGKFHQKGMKHHLISIIKRKINLQKIFRRNGEIMKIKTIVLINLLILFIGCGNNKNERKDNNVKQLPKTFIGMVKQYYELQANPDFSDAFLYDRYTFYNKYSSEILNTLQIKDSIVTDKIGVALYSYSIGPVSYNGRLWLRKINDDWKICLYQYFSDYSDDPFEDGLPERAKEIIKKVDSWKKTNKGSWWED